MSYAGVIEGLHERFATVPGIAAILDYEPSSVQVSPLLYSVLDRVELGRMGQVRTYRYYILHRLLIRWQDGSAAERELIPFVNAIPAAVSADPHLGGRLGNGIAEIESIDALWTKIAGVEYRTLDFMSNVLEK